MYILYFTKNRD
jgi:hypothetical protein